MRLVLHIGTEKTASTTLQHFLYRNQSALAEQGYALLSSLLAPKNRKLVAYCMDDSQTDGFFTQRGLHDLEQRHRYLQSVPDDLANEVTSLPASIHTVVITSEHFHSRLHSLEELQRLHRVLHPVFADIRILGYFREQSALARSLYSTAMRVGRTAAFEQSLGSVRVDSLYYNYHLLLNLWASAFGASSVQARLFDRSAFVGGDIRHDLLAQLGPGIDAAALAFDPEPRNPSLGAHGLRLARLINQACPACRPDGSLNPNWRRLMDALTSSRLAYQGSLAFPQAAAIHADFHQANVAFAAAFLGVAGNPFRVPQAPDHTEDDRVTLDDLAEFVAAAAAATAATPCR